MWPISYNDPNYMTMPSAISETEQLKQWALQLSSDYLPDGWQRVSSSAFTKVAFHEERGLYYKEYLPRSPAEDLKAMVRGSRAKRARRNAERLEFAGFDAPANVYWGKLPGGHEYLYTQAAPGHSVTDWLRDTATVDAGQADSRQLRWQLLAELGVFIGRLHATGFVHGDLRPGNVLAAHIDGRFRFTLIDNERLLHARPAPGRKLLRNLMQLNMLPSSQLSRSDRMRFFVNWRRQMRDLAPMEAKIIAAEAWLWAMRRLNEKGLY